MLNWRAAIKKIDFLTPNQARRLLWLGMTVFFIALFLKLTWELHEDAEIATYDQQILRLIAGLRLPVFNGAAVDITALGSPTVLTLFTLFGVALLWLKGDWRGGFYLGIGSLGAGVGTWVMKQVFSRGRPDVVPRLVEVSGFSYPSGHSLAATSFYLLVAFLLFRQFREWRARLIVMLFAALLITGVCFSRLYLGVHYPSDVLSGALFGVAWVSLLTALYSRRPT